MVRAADFFVSYTGADQAWAEWIAWQLEAEGYKVAVQAWDFGPGRDWTHEIQQATLTAERVVAVLSAAYLQSGHGEAEWRAFYAKDPSGERGLLRGCPIGRGTSVRTSKADHTIRHRRQGRAGLAHRR
jgi:hypothetical protein